VEEHGDTKLVDPGPEAIMDRVPRRASLPAARADRPGSQQNGTNVAVGHEFELPKGPFDVHERDVGGSVDATSVTETPVVFDPPIEGTERGREGRRVVLERGLHADP